MMLYVIQYSVLKSAEFIKFAVGATRTQKALYVLIKAFPMLANVITGVRGSMEAGFAATQTLKIGLPSL